MAKLTVKTGSVSRSCTANGDAPVRASRTSVRSASIYARHIGRVGALAVALGVGVAVATGQAGGVPVAWAQDGSNDSSSDGGGQAGSTDDNPTGGEHGDGASVGGGSNSNPGGGETGGGNESGSGAGVNIGSSGGVDTSTNDGGQSTDTNTGGNDESQGGGAPESASVLQPTTPSTPTATSAPVPTATSSPQTPSTTLPHNNTNANPPTGKPTSNPFVGTNNAVAGGASGSLGSSTPTTGAPVVAPLNFASSGGQNLRTLSSPAGHTEVSTLADTNTPPAQTAAMGLGGAIVSLATSLVAVFLSPFLGSGPSAPAEPPLLWALLGFVRREFFNTNPKAVADDVTTSEDSSKTITVLGNDVDDDPLTIAGVTQPTNGTVTINNDGTLTYKPKANWSGTETFTYTVTDATAGNHIHGLFAFSSAAHQSTATVTVHVTAVNDAPVADNESYGVAEDGTLTVAEANGVLVGDTDVDNTAAQLKAVLGTEPSHGTLTLNDDGSFDYKPNADYNGADSFTYKASDGTALSNSATVTINVTPVNDAPVAVADSYSINENTPLTIAAPGVLSNDSDVDSITLKSIVVANPAHGSLALNDNGSFTYTPATNYSGTDSFTYKVNDGTVDGNTTTVNITVNDVANGLRILGEPITADGYQYGALTTDKKRVLQSSTITSESGAKSTVLRIVDVQTGETIGEPVTFAGQFNGLTYNADKSRALVASYAYNDGDTGFALIDTATGAVLGQPQSAQGYVTSSFSSDGQRVIVYNNGSYESGSTLTVLDAATGAVIGTPVHGDYYSYRLNADQTRALVFLSDPDSGTSTVKLYDATTGTLLPQTTTLDGVSYSYGNVTDYSSPVYWQTYSESQNTSDFALFDAATYALIHEPLSFDGNAYPRFNDDGTRAVFISGAAGEATRTVTVVDTSTGAVMGTPVTVNGTYGYAYLRDGVDDPNAYVTSYSSNYGTGYELNVIDTTTGAKVGDPIVAEEGESFSNIEFNEDGTRAYVYGNAGSYTRTFRVVDTATWTQLGQTATVPYDYSSATKFNADGSRAIFVGQNSANGLAIVNTVDGTIVFQETPSTAPGVYTYANVTDDGSRAYVIVRDYYAESDTLRLIDPTTGNVVGGTIVLGQNSGAYFSADGKRVYVDLTDDGANAAEADLQAYSTVTGAQVGNVLHFDGYVYGVDTTENGRFDIFRSYSYQGPGYENPMSTFTVVDAASIEVVDSFDAPGAPEAKLFHIGDRDYLIATDENSEGYLTTLAIIDPDTGHVLGTPVIRKGRVSYQLTPENLIFSDDGTRLYLQTSDYTGQASYNQVTVIDTETGLVTTIPGVTQQIASIGGTTQFSNGRTMFALQTVDSVENPDLSTAQTVILYGGGEGDTAFVMPGVAGQLRYLDQTTLLLSTYDGEYTGQALDQSTVKTYLMPIDAATGEPKWAAPVELDGRYYDTYFYYDQAAVTVGDDMYLTTRVIDAVGSSSTQTTIVDRETGAELGVLDIDGAPVGGAVLARGGTRALISSEVTDSAGVKTTRVTLIDTATRAPVGEIVTGPGARRGLIVSTDGSRALLVSQPGYVPSAYGEYYQGDIGELTFTMFDTETGAVLGDPLSVDGRPGSSYYNLGEDGSRAYVTAYTLDSNNDYTSSTSYVIDTGWESVSA